MAQLLNCALAFSLDEVLLARGFLVYLKESCFFVLNFCIFFILPGLVEVSFFSLSDIADFEEIWLFFYKKIFG